jgi:uncharacterized membrane protein YkoI
VKKILRRDLLIGLALAGALAIPAGEAFAGEDGGKNGDGGDDSGGDDGGGDDSGGDDSGGDDSDSPSSGPPTASTASTTSGSNSDTTISKKLSKGRVLNQQEVQQVITQGKATSLPLVLAYVANNYPGQVLDVKLRTASGAFAYEVKVLSKYVFLKTILLDAKTLKKI